MMRLPGIKPIPKVGALLVAGSLLAGCGGSDYSDLQVFMDEVNARPAPPIQPLKSFTPAEPFAYEAMSLRSPFEPPVVVRPTERPKGPQVKPNPNRVKQYLEQYTIASLSMVGTLSQGPSMYALIQDSDGGVHRVQQGDYMGTDHGQIQSINEANIELVEIIPDGTGSWVQRIRTVCIPGRRQRMKTMSIENGRLARWIARPLLVAAALGFALPGWAANIEGVEFSSLPGDKTEIRLTFDGPPPEPTGYTIEQPARIVLDMPGVASTLEEKHHNLGIGNARRVSIISTKDRTRAIVNLTELVAYETDIEGNTLYLMVGGGSAQGVPTQQSFASASDTTVADTTITDSQITGVDFRRSEDGDGRIVIELSNPKAPVNVSKEGTKVKVQVRNTDLPSEFRRRLDVTDFATPVQIVDALQEGDHTTFTITAAGDYDYLAYQADNTLTVNVNALTAEEIEERQDVFKFSGEKLSLNFQDIEVRSVLQLIADFTDLNLVASDTVSGRITLRLKNVPWDQALELILKTKGLDQRQVGNVLLVAPAAEIAAREKLELENQKQISELAPLQTEFIQVRYASATQLFDLFNNAAGSEQSVLSERGSVIVDERTNAIILTDTADRLQEFRKVINQLDIPVRQVLIEARIVTASDNFSEDLGIRWGGAHLSQKSSTRFNKLGGSLTTLNDLQDAIVSGGQGEVSSPEYLAVDLGVTKEGASSFGIGVTGAGYLLDLELSALAADGHAEVVARPKVITADKNPAIIESGTEIPFQEATSSGATATSFKDATLALEVTPQITPDDRIIMELNVKQDTVGQIFNGVPSIDTNQIETQVLVDNGQTVVLGGIFTTDKQLSTTKTPFLGDLPYAGRLFRRTEERDDKTELLIFITPRIIQESLTSL